MRCGIDSPMPTGVISSGCCPSAAWVRRLWSSAILAFGQGPVARHESAASRHAMERDAQADQTPSVFEGFPRPKTCDAEHRLGRFFEMATAGRKGW